MKTFKIEIKETLSRIVEVEADSIEDALTKAKDSYNQELVVLDSDDFVDVEFVVM